MCWAPPCVPQMVLSLQSPWDGSSVPGLAKALAVEKELQGQKDTRTEGHLPVPFMPPGLLFPKTVACLSFPFPPHESYTCMTGPRITPREFNPPG